MKQPPKGAKFIKEPKPKVAFLRDIRGRLDNEVGRYFQLLYEKWATDETFPKGIGFWGGVRLLMPVIEVVAEVQGYKDTQATKGVQEFLRKLGIETPYLMWDLYRHSLMHNDEMQHAEDYASGKEISWRISINGAAHSFTSGLISIDVVTLYKGLRKYLDDEIELNDTTPVLIDVGVKYNDPSAPGTVHPQTKNDIAEL